MAMNHVEAQTIINNYYKGKANIGKTAIDALEWGLKCWNEKNEFSQKVNLMKQKIDSLKNTIRKMEEI